MVTGNPWQGLVRREASPEIEIDASGSVTEFQHGIFIPVTAESAYCPNSEVTVEPHGLYCFETYIWPGTELHSWGIPHQGRSPAQTITWMDAETCNMGENQPAQTMTPRVESCK